MIISKNFWEIIQVIKKFPKKTEEITSYSIKNFVIKLKNSYKKIHETFFSYFGEVAQLKIFQKFSVFFEKVLWEIMR